MKPSVFFILVTVSIAFLLQLSTANEAAKRKEQQLFQMIHELKQRGDPETTEKVDVIVGYVQRLVQERIRMENCMKHFRSEMICNNTAPFYLWEQIIARRIRSGKLFV